MSHRFTSFIMAALFLAALMPPAGRASADTVYFTAVNDHLLELNAETMPFYSGNVLYVSSRLFEGTELGISYGRSISLGLAILYTGTRDLRFDLAGQITYDKENNLYSGYAIERGGIIFFPLNLVCRYFGLTWTYNDASPAPLIRVKNDRVILSDTDFLDAAANPMRERYEEYTRSQAGSPQPPPQPPGEDEPPVHAAEGQKVYLLIHAQTPGEASDVLSSLDGVQATFLLTAQQMEDGDLLRALVSGGHGIALMLQGGAEEEMEEEILLGRALLWKAACSWLDMVWYDGTDGHEELFTGLGCVRVEADLRWPDAADGTAAGVLRLISRHQEDLGIYLGEAGEGLEHLPGLLEGLEEGRYRVSAWRLTA